MAECPGVYRLSLMRDGGMARVRVPGGAASAAQLRCIADISRTFGNGLIDLTNRANLQIRGLDERERDGIVHRLRDVELLCADPDVDRLRNITASPLAGLDPSEIIDVHPYVAELDDLLQTHQDTAALSVKFALVLDGGGEGCLSSVGHDLGFFARRLDGAGVFEISLAGQRTRRGVVPKDVKRFSAEVLRLFADQGATRARDLLECRTTDEVLSTIFQSTGIVDVKLPDQTMTMKPELMIGHFRHGWTFGVPLSRLTSEQVDGLAELAIRGAGMVRLTPFQCVVVPDLGVDAGTVAAGLGLDQSPPPVRVIACAGASGCIRTQADTKADGLRLRKALAGVPLEAGARARTIHLSGCPRGCAMPGASDILALAQTQSANYALHAGSRPSTADQEPSHKADIAPHDLPDVIRAMID